jgi:hypothetical protein
MCRLMPKEWGGGIPEISPSPKSAYFENTPLQARYLT